MDAKKEEKKPNEDEDLASTVETMLKEMETKFTAMSNDVTAK